MTHFEERLRALAGEDVTQAALTLQARGGVREIWTGPDRLRYLVAGAVPQEVELSAEGIHCGCEHFAAAGSCIHAVAAVAEAGKAGLLEAMLLRRAGLCGMQLLDTIDAVIPEIPVRLEVVLSVTPGTCCPTLRAGLRLGFERMYVVRSLPQFFQAIRDGQDLTFGKGLTLNMGSFRAEESSQPALRQLQSIHDTLAQAGAVPTGAAAKWLPLTDGTASALLSRLENAAFRMMCGETQWVSQGIREEVLPLDFRMEETPHGLAVTAEYPRTLTALTRDCRYVLWQDRVVRTDAAQRRLLPLIIAKGTDGLCSFLFERGIADWAAGELIPALQLAGAVTLGDGIQRRLIREALQPRVYLDREQLRVTARVSFCYGDRELNPFAPAESTERRRAGEKLLLRDAEGEHRVLSCLDRAGFCVRRSFVTLEGEEDIFRFITEGVRELQGVCEVYLSKDFRRMSPRRPNFSGSLTLRERQLVFTLEDDGEPTEEMLAILQAIANKKRYFRLQNGDFLDLSDLEAWTEAAQSLSEAAVQDAAGPDSREDSLVLQHYRVGYLATLMREAGLPVRRDESVKAAVRALSGKETAKPVLPDGLALRNYQQAGLEWLYNLDRIGMGGILADDMGLGKTVQIIALLSCIRRPGEVSLIVAPTSLVYNWQSELQRFAPDLSLVVLSGTADQREKTIRHIQAQRDVDVLITSYPLIRRDIDALETIDFRLAVLDEAQQIKNVSSAGASAVRRIRAGSRFALTGTPLENNVGELWNLVDFVLPGYLGTYTSFMRKYQDGRNEAQLRRKIRPFLLRRLKREVLAELPDKQERVITAQMTQEQQTVYRAAMLRLRGQVDRVLREKGFGRGRGEVLSAITELREICCHPSLVMDGYRGTSGKIPLLLDLLPGILASGHRVLLFSQFTGMLRILQRQMENAQIRCLYLDGETPAAQRLDLCEHFNGGEGDVFLISLKAGGLGLNLTGADLVIHYDPWWNPAVEDQATDRAHRIGQTHKVEVLRLVMHDTIEEQVVTLGERKRALFDKLITPGEQQLAALTEQDIRRLFS